MRYFHCPHGVEARVTLPLIFMASESVARGWRKGTLTLVFTWVRVRVEG